MLVLEMKSILLIKLEAPSMYIQLLHIFVVLRSTRNMEQSECSNNNLQDSFPTRALRSVDQNLLSVKEQG